MKSMSLSVLLRLVIILSCFLTIVLACKQWITRENYRTGAVLKCCAISCNPGSYVVVCASNWTVDECSPCPERTYMEDPTNSSLPQSCIPHECPPNSIPTDSFPLSGCQKKCRCDETNGFEGPDPCNCQHKSKIQPSKTSHNENIKDSNTSSTNKNLKEKGKNEFSQTNTDRSPNDTIGEDNRIYLNGNHDTSAALWIVGGVFLVFVPIFIVIITVCCRRGGFKRNRKDSIFTSTCSYQVPPITERTQRPEARVSPFRCEDAESNNERTQPLLVPDGIDTHLVSQSAGSQRLPDQTHYRTMNIQDNHEFGLVPGSSYNPHTINEAINVQGNHGLSLGPAPNLDPHTMDEESLQRNGFMEYVDSGVHVEDRYHPSNYYSLSDDQTEHF